MVQAEGGEEGVLETSRDLTLYIQSRISRGGLFWLIFLSHYLAGEFL